MDRLKSQLKTVSNTKLAQELVSGRNYNDNYNTEKGKG